MPFAIQALIFFVAGGVAGIINSMAGGGILVSFPALVFSGASAINAAATSKFSLLVGGMGSLWSYRHEFATQKRWAWRFAPPSLLGGLFGAILLLYTGEARFRSIVPYLILFATALFILQPAVSRWLQIEADTIQHSRFGFTLALFFQFCVGLYAGYFGAGIGILMLAALGILGQKNIHEMNSLKVLLGSLMNGMAAVYFGIQGNILWPEALVVAAGALAGGYLGPKLARRLGPAAVRTFVSIVGLGIGLYFLLQQITTGCVM
ncbi:MAG: sulfite exporter TauE/SafE family protein [Acidobacteria bacterium]|nr:sulfite exporter TauE/SafE family protein [Acidobacteriota bacterium]